jgi:hypothetical protein
MFQEEIEEMAKKIVDKKRYFLDSHQTSLPILPTIILYMSFFQPRKGYKLTDKLSQNQQTDKDSNKDSHIKLKQND